MQLSDKEKEEIELLVDQAFLKLTGRTWREPPGDSLGKIKRDFPALFGKPDQ